MISCLHIDATLSTWLQVRRAEGISRGAKEVNPVAVDLTRGQLMDAGGILGSKGSKSLKLQWKKFDGMAKQVGGSGNIFLKLFGDKEAGGDTFWLDSSSTEQALFPACPRRSFLTFMAIISSALLCSVCLSSRAWFVSV